ncbi:dihydrolipoamide dehydrogenase [Keratinibaculum paraultunense]|uniref:Dihydrolipoyl dehydrogenase n=1 Tax=Keratinibaculum paraultunense TaxID=1278232 RepID=A0A4R3KNN0_9FIRM|nr:dihydrolipoyl dehydrogenase [Keratinibaculum paraultunense]QQY79376.1 dihydrolipoyl dehydrogenase [Keratinibaculum paraultunense]TCS86121.1 dihydrolipoamide dehydrogenase [Keratinibaculum paraultunense]
MTKNIAVIGAGPGGYVAAIRGAQLGANIYLIEEREVGGTCLNRGCIPTKTYFRNAEIMRTLRRSKEFGITVDNFKLDGKALQERKKAVVGQLVGGIEKLISSYKNIEFIPGRASIKDKNTIVVNLKDGETREISVDNIIIATGSKPTMTETKGVDLEGVITSDDLLEMEEIPETLIVVGGGVIGLEFASIYQELGSQVILLASRILKNVDMELTRRLPIFFKKQGMETYVDIRAKEIIKEGDKLKVIARYKNKDKEIEVVGDKVLIASGRGPVVEGLNLDKVGIEYDNHKGIKVNEHFETTVEGIYAIGDVNDLGIQLAHVASSQGIYVMERLMGLTPDINLDVYPNCVFTLPEVAFVGLTEEQLKEKNIDYISSKFMFAANGKALSLGEGEGFIKVFASKEDKKILGITIVGPHANDLIHEGALVIANDLKLDAITRTIHAHPTLSEAFMEAVHGLEDKAIHMAPPRKKRK